jgi:hypothetical protein
MNKRKRRHLDRWQREVLVGLTTAQQLQLIKDRTGLEPRTYAQRKELLLTIAGEREHRWLNGN